MHRLIVSTLLVLLLLGSSTYVSADHSEYHTEGLVTIDEESFSYSFTYNEEQLISDISFSIDVEYHVEMIVGVFLVLLDLNTSMEKFLNGSGSSDWVTWLKLGESSLGSDRLEYSIDGSEFYKTKVQQNMTMNLIFAFSNSTGDPMEWFYDWTSPLENFYLDYTNFVPPFATVNPEEINLRYVDHTNSTVTSDCECAELLEISYNFTIVRDIYEVYSPYYFAYLLENDTDDRIFLSRQDGVYSEVDGSAVNYSMSSYFILPEELPLNSTYDLVVDTSVSGYISGSNEGGQVNNEEVFEDEMTNSTLRPFSYTSSFTDSYHNDSNGLTEWYDIIPEFSFSDTVSYGSYRVYTPDASLSTWFLQSGEFQSFRVPLFHPEINANISHVAIDFNVGVERNGMEFFVNIPLNITLNLTSLDLAPTFISPVSVNSDAIDYNEDMLYDGLEIEVGVELLHQPQGLEQINLDTGYYLLVGQEKYGYSAGGMTFEPELAEFNYTHEYTGELLHYYEEVNPFIDYSDATVGVRGHVTLRFTDSYYIFVDTYQDTELRLDQFDESYDGIEDIETTTSEETVTTTSDVTITQTLPDEHDQEHETTVIATNDWFDLPFPFMGMLILIVIPVRRIYAKR